MTPRAIAERARKRANTRYLPAELIERDRIANTEEWANEPLPSDLGLEFDREIESYLAFYAVAGTQVA